MRLRASHGTTADSLITQRSTHQGHRDARQATGRSLKSPPNMITVSESSAEATQLVRTGRYTLPRRRSSTTRNETPRHANAWPISVHTRRAQSDLRSTVPSAGLARMERARRWRSSGARVSRHIGAQGIAGQGQEPRSFSAGGAPPWLLPLARSGQARQT